MIHKYDIYLHIYIIHIYIYIYILYKNLVLKQQTLYS